jgi:hypothetical protein
VAESAQAETLRESTPAQRFRAGTVQAGDPVAGPDGKELAQALARARALSLEAAQARIWLIQARVAGLSGAGEARLAAAAAETWVPRNSVVLEARAG